MAIVVVVVALISIMLNVYFYLPDDSEMPPGVDDDGANNSNLSNVSNMSDENEMKMHRIAVVEITPGSTTEID